jgi:hypothetical protein
MKLSKNITLVIFTLSVFFSASAFTPQNVSATCGVGYTKNSTGQCVNITKQRSSVAKLSKRMSANALCLSIKNWTPERHKACMAGKGFK